MKKSIHVLIIYHKNLKPVALCDTYTDLYLVFEFYDILW